MNSDIHSVHKKFAILKLNRAEGTRAGTGTLWGATGVAQKISVIKRKFCKILSCSKQSG
jgi:hypothetical protein